jgi:hypothetical protein
MSPDLVWSGAKFGHGTQIVLLAWRQSDEADAEDTAIQALNGRRRCRPRVASVMANALARFHAGCGQLSYSYRSYQNCG